jgi:DNA replication protein DnaC
VTAPAPVVSSELKAVLRQVKLGRCVDTLPERLALAKARSMGHAEFLELVLSDEVTRRETTSAALRARTAGLDPSMGLENWDETTKVVFDRQVWDELCSLRFVDAGHNAMILGPVGVGKTFMATALGHAAVRRRYTVMFERTDVLLKRLRASRLDNSHDAELRKLIRVDLLILDDFALQAFDALDTADIYELIVERHRAAATVITSNREPSSGSPRWPTPSSPSPLSTGSNRRPTSSFSTASPTGAAKNPGLTSAPPPREPAAADALDPPAGLRHHQ